MNRGSSLRDGSGQDVRPELADIGRLARRLVRRTVTAARAEDNSITRLLADHLGAEATTLPVARASWPAYDQVNVQAGVDAWVAQPGRTYELVGLIQDRYGDIGLAHMLQEKVYGLGIGGVLTDAFPAGPGGLTRPCVQCGIYLTKDPGGPAAVFVHGPEEHRMREGVQLEIACRPADRAPALLAEIRRLSMQHNVFRGHVITFGDEVFEHRPTALLSFVERPNVARDQVILPPHVLEGVERQVIGAA